MPTKCKWNQVVANDSQCRDLRPWELSHGTDCFREAVADTKSDLGSDNVRDQMLVVNAKPLQYIGSELLGQMIHLVGITI